MNQRIRELAVQADTYAHNRMAEIGGSYLEYHRERFAELIVRECGKVYIQNQQDGVMTLTQDLLQHFGVGE